MTKKDYELVAKAMRIAKPLATDPDLLENHNWRFTVSRLIDEFKQDNPKFQPKKFAHACGWVEYDPR